MEKAKQSVAELQKTITETDVAPEKQQALDEIAAHCDDFQADPTSHHLSLRERLRLSMIDFEADHPKLTDAMQVALYDLSNAGV